MCDDEISIAGTDCANVLLETLARIPRAEIYTRDKRARDKHAREKNAREPELWSPAARPMGPVLRVGLFAAADPLVNKQVVVCDKSAESRDDTLLVPAENLDAGEVSL